MEKDTIFPERTVQAVLRMYGFDGAFCEPKEYISFVDDDEKLVKLIFSVWLAEEKRVVVKILHEEGDLLADREEIERQSAFSECMRQNGIRTPRRYRANGRYCNEIICHDLPCNVTVEDWCGEEITEINAEIAYRIGELMAEMHLLSLANHCEIGCGTLFSAAYENDVDAFEEFCQICENEHLDQTVVTEIKALRSQKQEKLRAVWDLLPKTAVQGDISINNLVYGEDQLTVFDYNNAGDEVLISDLVMEGLLTAYEMELPAGTDPQVRETFFPALLKGYLSRRSLSIEEADAAWIAYTLYHALWFTRIVYHEDSLEKLVARNDYEAANRLLANMLADMTEADDGRFRTRGEGYENYTV